MSKESDMVEVRSQKEWSFFIKGEDISFKGIEVELNPDEKDRTRIAARLGVPGISDLRAWITAHRIYGGHIVKVAGRFTASVVQSCVVTMEPLRAEINDEFEAYFINAEDAVPFTAAGRKLKRKAGLEDGPIMEEWEDPETMEDGQIDLGELVIQYLSLALEPFPHAPGAVFREGDEGHRLRRASELRKNPFAALQYWEAEEDDN